MRRCPVAAWEEWEGWEGWTTKRDLHESSEWAAALLGGPILFSNRASQSSAVANE
jgi:hypothetical protein